VLLAALEQAEALGVLRAEAQLVMVQQEELGPVVAQLA
jgi:hypothetical protein